MGGSSLWRNIAVNADINKNGMYAMYPEGTEYISAYLESRGGPFGATLFVGLQAFLLEYLSRPITVEDVQEAERVVHGHGSRFNRQAWLDIVNDYDGYLPLEIEAAPEGTVVPTRNVLLQVVNTDPRFPWLPSYIECALQRALWYPSTVGTTSWICKQAVRGALERTSDHPELLRLYLHDFGARGANTFESAALGGMAHMVNFDRSDTVPAFIAASQYYNAAYPGAVNLLCEHSNVSAFGPDGESDFFRKLLSNTNDAAIAFLVDTYDQENCVRNVIGKELRDEILAFPGLVGIRCDSGDPVTNPVDVVEDLMESLGSSRTAKGFKVLPPNVRVVQGDGLNVNTFRRLYAELERRGLAADNVLCGMGSGLLQEVNRDTLHFGYKANAARINGTWRDISKRPKANAIKHSKAGRLALQYVDGDYRTVPRDSIPPEENVLQPVFRDGKILSVWDFTDLIERSERPTPAYYYEDLPEDLQAAS